MVLFEAVSRQLERTVCPMLPSNWLSLGQMRLLEVAKALALAKCE
jgi:ABC-type branched-subunit amino acid transport system ATPase component